MAEPLLFLTGPTASGKSAVALRLAERLGAEIVSVDSMLVYRGMDIGTAKPSLAERARVPHHVIDVAAPTELYNVGRYVADAHRAADEIRRRGRRPLFVGGTPLYMKGLLAGIFDAPAPPRELRAELEARVKTEGAPALHEELRQVDPVAAQRLHPNDAKRIVRALEVFRVTGRSISELQREFAAGYAVACRIVALRRERDDLRARIERRTETMFARGWVEEVRGLLARGGFSRSARQAAGYGDVAAMIEGRATLAETIARVKSATWRIARKQMTWLRHLPEVTWLDAGPKEGVEELENRLYNELLT